MKAVWVVSVVTGSDAAPEEVYALRRDAEIRVAELREDGIDARFDHFIVDERQPRHP